MVLNFTWIDEKELFRQVRQFILKQRITAYMIEYQKSEGTCTASTGEFMHGAFLAHHGENLGTRPSISLPGPRNSELLLRIKQTVLNSTLKKTSGYS